MDLTYGTNKLGRNLNDLERRPSRARYIREKSCDKVETSLAKRMPKTQYHHTSLHLAYIDVLSSPGNGTSLFQSLPLQYLCTESTLAPSPKETPSPPAHDAELRRLLWNSCFYKDACEIPLLVDRECGVNTTHGALGMWPGGTWKYFTVEKICQEKGIPWFMIDPRIYFYCKWDCELNLR